MAKLKQLKFPLGLGNLNNMRVFESAVMFPSLSKIISWECDCLPKGRHSDGAHEFQGCSSQKCSRGGVGHVGVGWVM